MNGFISTTPLGEHRSDEFDTLLPQLKNFTQWDGEIKVPGMNCGSDPVLQRAVALASPDHLLRPHQTIELCACEMTKANRLFT